MNSRLIAIRKKNAALEKESPYNFCDRWCERCTSEKQLRCKLYKDELERNMICLGHGKDPDDHEMHKAILEEQFEQDMAGFEERLEEWGVDPNAFEDSGEDPELEEIKKTDTYIKNHHLHETTEQYRRKAHNFLKKTFYREGTTPKELAYDFDTVAWYHTLLTVKLKRALAGFHEPPSEEDYGLCDAVAQFEVCQKAVRESIQALSKIELALPAHSVEIKTLLALLHNITSRIDAMVERI